MKSGLDVRQALLEKHKNLIREINELDSTISKVHEEYSARLKQLQTNKGPLEEALHHVEALLRLEGCDFDSSHISAPHNDRVELTTKMSATDAAFKLLKELHQPLHYKDIVSKLQERNIYIPGKDSAATLLSRIHRDKRFKRTKNRGVYSLSGWRLRKSKSKSVKNRKKSVGK